MMLKNLVCVEVVLWGFGGGVVGEVLMGEVDGDGDGGGEEKGRWYIWTDNEIVRISGSLVGAERGKG